jgi:hypothetical protein
MQQLVNAYEGYRQANVLPASYEIVNGHAWATSTSGEAIVPLESLKAP